MTFTMSQRQMASKRLVSTMDILQLNNQDLNAYIQKQEAENPLVVLKGKREEYEDRSRDRERKLAWLEESDEQNRIYYETDLGEDDEPEDWQVPGEQQESLAEFVFAQLMSACSSEEDERILWDMACGLDDRGYLVEPLEVYRDRYGLREVDCYRYLYLLQNVEPAGIGARNLVECLLLQLDRLPEVSPEIRQIVMTCLELIGEGKLAKVAARLGISQEQTERYVKVIRKLNPKPGRGFSTRENLRYLLPDVTVVKFSGYFQVLLGDNAYPQVRVDKYYRGLMEQPDIPVDTREYLENQMCLVNQLIEGIRERGELLVQVTGGLVEILSEFFEKGPGYRRTLTMEELAEHLGLTTELVNKVVQDKYVQCPWGIYPLNYFFRMASSPAQAESLSQPEEIERAIRRIVDAEDKKRPLSDRKIMDRLKDEGLEISRRTVAKYRSRMGIPEADDRREW